MHRHPDTSRSTPSTLSRRQWLAGSTALLGAGLLPGVGHAAIAHASDAVNRAGRLRMLSQRMAKAWLAVGQQIESPRAERALEESVTAFDRQLVDLKAFAPTPAIRTAFTQLDTAWTEYKGQLVRPQPTAAAVPGLIALDAKVLALAHQCTLQLEQHTGQPSSQLVNLAGRQRMLSQRMAKYHLALAWRTSVADAASQIEQARGEFGTALDRLSGAKQTTPAIQQQLTLARQQWLLFDAALARNAASPGRREAEHVFTVSENMLEVMDQITDQYAQQHA